MKFKVKIVVLVTFILLGILCIKSHMKVAYCQEEFKVKEIKSLNIDIKNYYYQQLSANEQKIYDGLVSSKEDIMDNKEEIFIAQLDLTYEEANKNTKEMFTRAIWAYRLDNPISTLWLSNYNKKRIYPKGEENEIVTVNFSLLIEGKSYYDFDSKEDLLEAICEVEDTSQEFVKGLVGTDEEKLLSIYKWLLQGTKYNKDNNPHMNDLYGCIIRKETVCGGLAYSMKYVADMANLPVICVYGEFIEKDNTESQIVMEHVWNMIYLNNRWYISDLTGDLSKEQGIEPTNNKFMLSVKTRRYRTNIFQVPN